MFAITPVRKFDGSAGEREEGVILPDADILTGIEFRSALAYDDVSGGDAFSAELLDTKPLGVGVTSIASRAGTFLRGKKLKVEAEHSRVSIAGRVAKEQAAFRVRAAPRFAIPAAHATMESV